MASALEDGLGMGLSEEPSTTGDHDDPAI